MVKARTRAFRLPANHFLVFRVNVFVLLKPVPAKAHARRANYLAIKPLSVSPSQIDAVLGILGGDK